MVAVTTRDTVNNPRSGCYTHTHTHTTHTHTHTVLETEKLYKKSKNTGAPALKNPTYPGWRSSMTDQPLCPTDVLSRPTVTSKTPWRLTARPIVLPNLRQGRNSATLHPRLSSRAGVQLICLYPKVLPTKLPIT